MYLISHRYLIHILNFLMIKAAQEKVAFSSEVAFNFDDSQRYHLNFSKYRAITVCLVQGLYPHKSRKNEL